MKEDQLSEAERKLFSELENETSPPAGLEQSILTQLKEEGLIKNESKTSKIIDMKNYLKWGVGVAAAILVFFAGIYFERTGQGYQIDVDPDTEPVVQIEPAKGYMLILYEDANFQPGDPMDMFNEYSAWMENTFARGIKITGQELKNEASVVTSELVSSLDESAQKRTTGYFLLEANSMDEAIEVAKENPHVKYGGIVEVKSYMVR